MRKAAIITGASRGIGRALALQLATSNTLVYAVARSASELETLAAVSPDNIVAVVADISTPSGRRVLLETIGDQPIDFLVNNAAIITPLTSLDQYSESDVQRIIDTNLTAPMLLTNALLRHLTGGRILNVTSVAADAPIEQLGGYCITKCAINRWTEQLQLELRRKNIFVASVIPGEVDTAMQGELRRAPEESFLLAAEFQRAAQARTLIAPETVALFLEWILKTVPNENYARPTPWNIYDAWHRQQWIQHHSLPLPLNQAKLGDQSEIADRELLARSANNCAALFTPSERQQTDTTHLAAAVSNNTF